MLRITNQVFIKLLGFSSSLATNCLPLNDETCMVRPTITDWSPFELNITHS